MIKKRPIEERFWEKVDRRSSSECWNWQAAKNEHGYGIIGKGSRKDGVIRAHILSWEIANGCNLPTGMVICHQCDNRACVSPAHLRAGTQKENVHEAVARNRGLGKRGHKGTSNSQAKLNNEVVSLIRREFTPHKVTRRMLAQRFGVTESAIKKVLAGDTWGHI